MTVLLPRKTRGQRGQALPIFALAFILIIGLVALVVDGGISLGDKRKLQAAADVASLAGAADTINVVSGAVGACAALQVAQSYAWQNLSVGHALVPANCTGPNGSGENTWTEVAAGYTVTATYPYFKQLSSHPHWDANASVHVVVDHVLPTAFARAFGTNSVTTHAAAAAKTGPGTKPFPFALATHYLQIQGSGAANIFGAALIGNCDDSGVGDYTANNHNGGLWATNGTNLNVGTAQSSSGVGNYTSAQAVLLAKPPATCSAPANNAETSVAYSNMAPSVVCFEVTCPAPQNVFNAIFGFNSGPSGCATVTISSPPCQLTAYGDGGWQDSACWTGGSGAANIGTLSPGFVAGSPAPSPTATPCSAAGPVPPKGTREGSFADNTLPQFPQYQSGEDIVDGGALTLANVAFTPAVKSCGMNFIPANLCPGNPLSPGSNLNGGNKVYTSVGGGAHSAFTLGAGWYVFDGPNASFDLSGGPSNITCVAAVPDNGWPGCLFVFRDGAHFDMKDSALDCSLAAGSGVLPCSFAFTDTSRPTSSYMSIGCTSIPSCGSTFLTPIPYNAGTATNPIPADFPVITSNSANNGISANPNGGPAAITISGNGGSFDLAGTIFAPFGTLTIGQNAAPEGGQTIADIINLQGGSFASGVAAYNGGTVAPAPGPAVLFE